MPNYTAQDRLDESAVFLNDANKTMFTFDVLLPFLKITMQELEDVFVANSVNYSLKKSAVIPIGIGVTVVPVPDDFLLPILLQERPMGGTDDQFVDMVEKSWSPSEKPIDALRYWVWQNGQELSLLGATTSREVCLKYYRSINPVSNMTDSIGVTHVKQYISGHVASLAAFVIGENVTRAQALDDLAQTALNRALSISARRGQSRPVRRIPFGTNRRW